jgi:hypothetical protein
MLVEDEYRRRADSEELDDSGGQLGVSEDLDHRLLADQLLDLGREVDAEMRDLKVDAGVGEDKTGPARVGEEATHGVLAPGHILVDEKNGRLAPGGELVEQLAVHRHDRPAAQIFAPALGPIGGRSGIGGSSAMRTNLTI